MRIVLGEGSVRDRSEAALRKLAARIDSNFWFEIIFDIDAIFLSIYEHQNESFIDLRLKAQRNPP
jgi:hypothetical protein